MVTDSFPPRDRGATAAATVILSERFPDTTIRLRCHWSVKTRSTIKEAIRHEDFDALCRLVDQYENDASLDFRRIQTVILCCRYNRRDLLVAFLRYYRQRLESKGQGTSRGCQDFSALEEATQGHIILPRDGWPSVLVARYLLRLLVSLTFATKRELDRLVVNKWYVADQSNTTKKLIKELYKLGWRRRCQAVLDVFRVYIKDDWREHIERRYR